MPNTPRQSVLLDVFRQIVASPRLSQRKVAASLGISVGSVNYCIRALVDKGFIKAENYRNSSRKRAYVYLLTPAGIAARAEMTRDFLARKIREYNALQAEIEQLKKESLGSAAGPESGMADVRPDEGASQHSSGESLNVTHRALVFPEVR